MTQYLNRWLNILQRIILAIFKKSQDFRPEFGAYTSAVLPISQDLVAIKKHGTVLSLKILEVIRVQVNYCHTCLTNKI